MSIPLNAHRRPFLDRLVNSRLSSRLSASCVMFQSIVACLIGVTLFGLVYLWEGRARSRSFNKSTQKLKNLLRNQKASLSKTTQGGDPRDVIPTTERNWGQWMPDAGFQYPTIQPLQEYDIASIEPIAYRPFR